MVLSAQTEAVGAKVDLAWTLREHCQEADSLSNMEFEGFDQKRRVPIDITSIPWKVLPASKFRGQSFTEERLRLKAARANE